MVELGRRSRVANVLLDDNRPLRGSSVLLPPLNAPGAGVDSGVWVLGVQTLAGSAATGGVPPYTYAWTIDSGGAGTFTGATTLTPTWAPDTGAVYQLRITATDAAGQTASATLSIQWVYAAGTTGADLFTADALNVGGSELQEFWLAHDSAAYRTIGTGVSALIGQKGVANATNAVGIKQPAMVAAGANNGRGAVRFVAASLNSLITPAAFAGVTGQRWAVMFIGALTNPVAGTTRIHEFGVPAAGDALGLTMPSSTQVRVTVHYDNGGTGLADVVNFSNANIIAVAVFASSPHSFYTNHSYNNMAQSAGLSVRVNGNNALSFGRAVDADTGNATMDVWASALFKLAGTARPAGFDNIARMAAAYYQTPTFH